MANYYRSNTNNNSNKSSTQSFNDKIANELKSSSKFQQRFSKQQDYENNSNNNGNNENLYIEVNPTSTLTQNTDNLARIHITHDSSNIKPHQHHYENLFNPIRESINYETCILPIKQAAAAVVQRDVSSSSTLSKTPESIDEGWMSNSANSSSNTAIIGVTGPYTRKSNNSSSVSPSNDRGSGSAVAASASTSTSAGIRSGTGTPSDNEILDDYSTDDLDDEIEIEDDDDDVIDEDDEEIDEVDHQLNRQLNNDQIKHYKSTKQAPLPPPKLNELQKHLSDFYTQLTILEKPYIQKLAYLVGFRFHLQKYCDATDGDLNVLFTHVEQLHNQHRLFYNELIKLLNHLISENHINLLLDTLDIFNTMLVQTLTLYLDFLNNYPKAMIILNKFENEKHNFTNRQMGKSVGGGGGGDREQYYHNREHRKSFVECEQEYFQNVFTNNEQYDTAQIFSNDILKHPLEVVKYSLSLKEECFYYIQVTKNQQRVNEFNGENELNAKIKQSFDVNGPYNRLKEEIFTKIDRILLPNRIRKNEDVVELCENNERKLRHLILYGDCLVCCRIKKDKKQLKWFIPMDRVEIYLGENKELKKSDNELKNLRDEVATLSGDLRRQNENENSGLNSSLKRSTVKLKKKFDESQTELQLKLSKFKLIIRYNHSSLNHLVGSSIGGSMANLSNLNLMNTSTTSLANVSSSASKNETYQFLFTSDFERISWLEEINGAIYAYKSRKTSSSIPGSEVETRLNNLLKAEEPVKKTTFVTCTGTLELLISDLKGLAQPSKVFVAVELKSFGSYLQVAQTKLTECTIKPHWDEKFNLELQCVDTIRIILYCETSTKPISIGSHEIRIDPKHFGTARQVPIKINNNTSLVTVMKFLSPKKTITRRRTKNKNDIFGNNINDVLQREKTTIPRILRDCVEVIETKGIDEIGIYRVSAVVSEVQKMKELYSKNPKLAQQELRQKSPHLSASLLKLYLRELPEPLFTAHLYPYFINAIETCDGNVSKRDQMLCETFNKLPEANRTVLVFILNHLQNIANNSIKNKMDSRNLTTLFGPTLMKLSPKDKLEADNMAREISESTQQASVLFYILKLHSQEKLVQYGAAAAANDNINLINEAEQNLIKDINNNSQQIKQPSRSRPMLPMQEQQQQQPARIIHNKQTAL